MLIGSVLLIEIVFDLVSLSYDKVRDFSAVQLEMAFKLQLL